MKKIFLIIGLIFSLVCNGQGGIGGIGTYNSKSAGEQIGDTMTARKAEFDTTYIGYNGFTMELTKKTTPDSMLVIRNGTIGYGLAADMDKGSTAHFLYDTTGYYTAAVNSTASSTRILGADAAFAWPIYVGKTQTFDAIAFEVSTAVASTHIICALYHSDSNYYPTTKIITSKVFDGSSATFQVDYSCGEFTLYKDSIYFLMINCDGTPTARALGAGAMPNVLGYTSGASGYYSCWYDASYTYNGTLPAIFPSSGFAKAAAILQPILYMRQK